MPELPEVETIARGVNELLRGDRILGVSFSRKREPFSTPPEKMAEALPGMVIDRVRRVGKHIVFTLVLSSTEPPTQESSIGIQAKWTEWIVHLGMTGRLLVSAPGAAASAHTHCVLSLASGRELRFVDPRRFGRIRLIQSDAAEDRFCCVGREPLDVSSEDFRQLFRGRKTSIKAALLNQRLLAGVGNIYADESLFHAGIRPNRMAGRLTAAQLERLRLSLRRVLRQAIALGGSSVSDYVDASGNRGFFQLKHMVYRRTGQPCRVCGRPIRRIILSGRSSHFCPSCQR